LERKAFQIKHTYLMHINTLQMAPHLG